MAILLKHISKKVMATTLVEVLVASVLIIIIFVIASLSLNNVFKSTIKNNTRVIEAELNKIQYLYQHQKISDKYQDDLGEWEFSISKQKENRAYLQAKNPQTNRIIIRELVYETVQ